MEINEWFDVIGIAPGGQADQMGVRPGYKVVGFNGTPTGSDSLSICMNRVRVTPRPWTFTFKYECLDAYAGSVVPKSNEVQNCEHEEYNVYPQRQAAAEQLKNANLLQLLPPQTVASAPSQMQQTATTNGVHTHNDSAVHSQLEQSYQHQMQNQAQQKPAQAATAKDARITKDGTLALTRPQINIANHVLTTRYFKPEMGAEQWTRDEKETIVAEINRALVASQLEPRYTLQKLDQWQGNALYRYRCIQRNQKPDSWQGSHARSARQMSAADEETACSQADSDSDDGMMESGWTADEIAE